MKIPATPRPKINQKYLKKLIKKAHTQRKKKPKNFKTQNLHYKTIKIRQLKMTSSEEKRPKKIRKITKKSKRKRKRMNYANSLEKIRKQ